MFPVWFSTGFALGMAYSDGSQLLRDAHDDILRRSLEYKIALEEVKKEHEVEESVGKPWNLKKYHLINKPE